MNDQMASPTPAATMNAAHAWLSIPFGLIALGVLFALFILIWGARLAARRHHAQHELEDRGEAHFTGDPMPVPGPGVPPLAPAPPPLADGLPPTTPAVPTEPEAAPEPPLADEPIAAAAPLDASPASLAADVPQAAPAGDDLTRLKGVGSKLVDRLRELGITSFAQLASMTPAEAEALDAQLGNFQGRIHRDRWIEQARFLAANDVAGYEATFGKL